MSFNLFVPILSIPLEEWRSKVSKQMNNAQLPTGLKPKQEKDKFQKFFYSPTLTGLA